ncbi:MAG: glycosyltransferase family 4 protein [Phycisphaerae bacterium]|nr:glycosyltransferase family 4 protein [Saprospiraceae bacterium]
MPLILPVFFLILLGAELLYFRLARTYQISDQPNHRSSHQQVTLRGGGIIFPLAWLGYSIWNGFAYPYFTAGLLFIAGISFVDDLRPVSAKLRLGVHLLAFTLCFWELHVFELLPWWQWPLAYILCIGIVNAYNFMDGINGITGLYTLALFVPLAFQWGAPLTLLQATNPFSFLIAALLVFGFFNFRKKAVCFAGDVGSMSIGFTVLFLLVARFLGIWASGGPIPERSNSVFVSAGGYDWSVFLFLALYGMDTILTIAYRLWLKENIFQAHRLHLYQYLANECRWPQMVVAGVYAVIQIIINLWIINSSITLWAGLSLLLGLVLTYLIVLLYRVKIA